MIINLYVLSGREIANLTIVHRKFIDRNLKFGFSIQNLELWFKIWKFNLKFAISIQSLEF